MGKHQNQHLAEDPPRLKILNEAIRLFSEKGYDATSVREIVEAAGVTKPVLYYYFANKEALLREILSKNMMRLEHQLIEIYDGTWANQREQLNAVVRVFLETTHQQPELVRFIHAVAFSGMFDGVFDFHEYWMRNTRRLSEIFERARHQDRLRPDMSTFHLSSVFFAHVMNHVKNLVYCPELAREDPEGQTIVPLFLEGAGADASTPKRGLSP